MLPLLLVVLVAAALLAFVGRHWLRARFDNRSINDVVDMIRDRVAALFPRRSSQRRAEPWYRRGGRIRTLLVALLVLLLVAVVWRGTAVLRSPVADDRFVVRVAPFNVAGQDPRQGRLLAEQLADVLRTQVSGETDIGVIDESVADAEAALALAQRQRIDVLIWGSAVEGTTATQPGLIPQLVWLPNAPFVPGTWPGFNGRFALPATYDLALQPFNGAVVLPLVLDALGHFARGDADRANSAAEALLRDYGAQLRSELPSMLLALDDWAMGAYGDAEQRARNTINAADRPEHWNNLGVILNDSGQAAAAEEAFRRALQAAPDFAHAHANLARTLLDRQQPVEALAEIQTAVQLAPDVEPFRLLLGVAQRANGHLEAARTTFAALNVEAAVLSLTDVATATGRLEWELERPPIRSAQQLAAVRKEIENGIAHTAARRAEYLEQANAYGVAGRIVMQRLAEQAAARLQAEQYARRYDLVLTEIEAGRLEAAQPRNALARLWDGLRGRRTILQQARALAEGLREHLPAMQYDLLYQAGRAAFYERNMEAAQTSWDAAQAFVDQTPPGDPLRTRPEAHYGRALLSITAGNRAEARERLNVALAADGRFFPAHQQLALLAEQDGQWAEAEAHRRWLAEQRPFDPAGSLGVARALQAQGRLAEAEVFLIPLANAGNADALVLLGTLYRLAGRLDEAEEVLQRAFAIAPGRADLHEERAAIALARNDLQAAEAALKQAIRLDERRTSAYITLGQLYAERLGQPAAAAEQLRAAAKIDPNNPNAQRWLGEALLQLDQPDAAAAAFRRAIDVAPGDYAARHGLAQAYLALDRLDEAAQAEQQALEVNSTYVPALVGLGDIALRQGRLDVARDHYTAALGLDASAPGAYLGLGRVALRQGDGATAITRYREGLAVDPQNVPLLIALGDQLMQTNDVNGALDVYNQAKQVAPDNAGVHASLGRALWQAGQGDQALAELDLALRANPNDAETLVLVGEISATMQRFDAALDAYARAARARNDWFEPPFRRGVLLLQQQRTDEAIKELERSVRLNPDFPQGAYWLGRAYRAAGRAQDAERLLRRAVELAPAYYEARFFLGQTLDTLGQVAEARDIYQTILNDAPPTDPWRVEAQQALGNRQP